jgi:hypothetical protein
MTFGMEVEDAISQAFAPQSRDDARGILDPSMSSRVLLAVVALSRGDLELLPHLSDAAAEDFRDVLYWSETPRDPNEPGSHEELLAHLKLPPRGAAC